MKFSFFYFLSVLNFLRVCDFFKVNDSLLLHDLLTKHDFLIFCDFLIVYALLTVHDFFTVSIINLTDKITTKACANWLRFIFVLVGIDMKLAVFYCAYKFMVFPFASHRCLSLYKEAKDQLAIGFRSAEFSILRSRYLSSQTFNQFLQSLVTSSCLKAYFIVFFVLF